MSASSGIRSDSETGRGHLSLLDATGRGVQSAGMPDPTLSDIMAKLVVIDLEQRQQTGLLTAIVEGQQLMATNLDTLNASLDALNTATSQEAALLQADTAKLDAIQALITSIVNTAGVPQSVLDKASQIQAALSGVVQTTTAQAARLDQLGQDPRNPVPTPPPAG